MTKTYDLLIVGGGINGASIARAAAVAGQRVLLVEQGDLAQATSSASTKLMHGGLRYLEYYDFKLVREALKERAIMLRTAPHLVRPLEFRLPHVASMRPWPLVRIGLWLYDLLAMDGGLPRSRSIRIDDPGLKAQGLRGFSYWDGWVDDARLVALNAVDARDAGATIRTRTKLIAATRDEDRWTARLRAAAGDIEVSARILVNAAGPWVEQVLHEILAIEGRGHIKLVRGSHIVVQRRLAGDHAWLLQQPDGRVVFAIPYLDDHLLIGTTDIPVDVPDDASISAGEIDYLCDAANRYLQNPIGPEDIVGDYAGIRPLFDDGGKSASAVSRDYRLELDANGAPLLSVFGGKITTARHLAQVALQRLGLSADTQDRPLPGGDFADFDAELDRLRRRWPFLDLVTSERLLRAYGTRIYRIFDLVTTTDQLGRDFGGGLTAREVDYLVREEWAVTADDMLWRRTKMGYRLTQDQVAALSAYLKDAAG
jgi:glycerol-3-phosphate dehydrogenase